MSKRWPRTFGATILVGLVAGALVPVLMAGVASSALSVFFNQSVSGTIRCGKQQAQVADTPDKGYAAAVTVAYHNGCSTINNRLPGHLGGYAYLIQQSNGAVCVASGWQYNTTTSYQNLAAAPKAPTSCPGFVAYISQAKGRIWRGDTSVYVTSSFWSFSPALVLP